MRALFFGHLHTPSVRLLRAERRGKAARRHEGGAEAAEGGAARPAEGGGAAEGGGGEAGGVDAAMPVMYLSPSLTPRNPTPHSPAIRLYALAGARARGGADADAGAGTDGGGAGEAAWGVHEAWDHTLDLDESNARGGAVWREEPRAHGWRRSRGRRPPTCTGRAAALEERGVGPAHPRPGPTSLLGPCRLTAQLNLSSLRAADWRAWLLALHDDRAFVRHLSAQRCADEVEAPYAECKASVLCAMGELEDEPYKACLRRTSARAQPPPGWVQGVKRKP